METGKLIKELRIQKGMTQEELAEKTEVSTRTIQRIENGEVDPRAYTLQSIANALDVEFGLFLEKGSDENQKIGKVDDTSWLLFLYLTSLLPLIFPAVLIWKNKKNKTSDMAEHYRVVLSFQLMILGVVFGCLWVYWKVNMLTPLIGVLGANCLFTLFVALNAMSGKPPRRPPFFKSKSKTEKAE